MRVLPLLALALLPVACNPTIDFEVPVEGEATIAGGGLVPGLLEAFGLGDFARLDLSNTQEFENNDVAKEQVVNARLRTLTLTIVSGEESFDFLDSLSFSVEAPDLPREQVASSTVPDDLTTFAADTDDVDIAPYVRAESFAITSEVTGTQPSEDTTIKIELLFDVTAEVIGPGTTG